VFVEPVRVVKDLGAMDQSIYLRKVYVLLNLYLI
jgi:hypothetical protein